MGTVRTPEATQAQRNKILNIKVNDTDAASRLVGTKEVLEEIVNLLNNFTPEEEELVTKYSEKDGKPSEYEWGPSRQHGQYWDREIFLCAPNIGGIIPKLAFDEIKETGPFLIDTQHGKYVFSYRCKYHNHRPTEHMIESMRVTEI